MTHKVFIAVAAAGLVIVAAIHAPSVRAFQNNPVNVGITVSGYQASSSSPFNVSGNVIGDGVWQHLIGPVLSGPITTIPGQGAFAGAGCQAEYSQDQIVTDDGTLTVEVYGFRCVPAATPGAHSTVGAYSFVSGTGRFQYVVAGTGPVSINVQADGSASIHIGGELRVTHCSGGMCAPGAL